MIKGFKEFILKGNVVDMAVGVVIGVAFGNVVSSLVADIITPFIGAFGGTPDFSSLSFTINHSRFAIGSFFNALFSFLTISAVIYFFVVVPMNRLLKKMKGDPQADPAEKICPECLSSIPAKASRCKYCTAKIGK